MTRREEQRKTANEKILHAAATCFAEKGYDACTLQDIAGRAGMSKGAIYVYYKSKEEIFRVLMDVQYNLCLEKARPAALIKPCVDGIIWFIRECVKDCGFPIDHRLWAEIVAVISRNSKLEKHFQCSDGNLRSIFSELIQQGIDNGEVDPELNLEATVLYFTSLANGLILRMADDPNFDFDINLSKFELLIRKSLQP